MKVVIIAAMTRDRLIGKDGRIPWHDPEDLKHFKKVTMGHAVIMGRKTFESIGRPLPGRRNIVITRSTTEAAAGRAGPARRIQSSDEPGSARHATESLDIIHSLDEALRLCHERDEDAAFIIGGGQIYQQALPLADEMLITWIDRPGLTGDTFFPEWDPSQWTAVSEPAGGCSRVVTYRRIMVRNGTT